MLEWKRVEPTKIDKIGFRTIVTKHFVLPDGVTRDYQTVHPEGYQCVGCIAITPDNKVITAAQFRPGPEKIMYDAPGGIVEPGEDLLAAIKRELLEETGYESNEWTNIGISHKSAYNNGTWYYFMAKNCVKSDTSAKGDEDEFIEAELLSIPAFIENAKTGRMSDSDAVLMAYDSLMEIEHDQSN